MGDNIKAKITREMPGQVKVTHVFTGRLIGLARPDDMRAILNTKDAARRLFSAESMTIDDLSKSFSIKDRMVIATTCYSQSKGRAVYISPPIRCVGWESGQKKFVCANDIDIVLEDA